MRQGFTLIELLAVIIILGLLVVLSVPAYTSIYSSIKRNNYQSKLTDIETSALKYGSTIKDEIKNSPGSCKDITVTDLIKSGLITSEDKHKDVIYNPTDNTPLNGKIKLCYCLSEYDITAHYYVNFVQQNVYHVGDVVLYNGSLYECLIDYTNKSGIYGTKDGKPFFQLITC